MNLDCVMAQHIVEQIGSSLGADIWIVDASSHVLASTNAVETNGTKKGDHHISLPLNYANKEVGTLIMTVSAQQNPEVVQFAKTLADLIIYQTTVFEQLVDRQLALNQLVYHLLHLQSQDDLAVVVQEASLLQIDRSVPRIAVVFELLPFFAHMAERLSQPIRDPAGLSRQGQQLRQRLLHQIDECFPVSEGHLAAFPDENSLVVLAAIDLRHPQGWRQQVRTLVQKTFDCFRCIVDIPIRAGIGDYYSDWQKLCRSYQDANFALKVGSTLPDNEQIFMVDDLGLAAFVCSQDQSVPSRVTSHLLSPLLGASELLGTLEVFLNVNLSPSQAAEKLHIHRHTLTYRLQKIADLTGADPRNFYSAAKLLAALVWYRYRNATE